MPKYEKLKNDDDGYEFELNIPKKSLPSNSSTSTRVISTPNKASTTINSTLKNRTRSEFENGSNNKNSHTKNSRNSLSSSPESSVLNNFKVASAASTIKYLEYKIDHNNDSLLGEIVRSF